MLGWKETCELGSDAAMKQPDGAARSATRSNTMRLTAELILSARAHINPLRERELDLRGYKIPVLENLGATKDGFDCLDLSDNEIKKLENFPRLKRLRMLLLHNNKVHRIQDNLAESIPNLSVLLLTNNSIANLTDSYYREYVIHTLPHLRVLDFKKIRPVEREEAVRLFNSLAGKKIVEGAAADDSTHTNDAVALPASPPAAPAGRPTLTQLKVSIVSTFTAPSAPVSTTSPRNQAAPLSPTKKEAAVVQSPPRKKAAADATPIHPVIAPTVVSPKHEVKHEKAPVPAVPSPKQSPRKAAAVVVPAHAPSEDMEVDQAPPAAVQTPVKSPASKRAKAASTPASSMKVIELREELKRRGLPTKGNKAELVARLESANE
ncbi:hypothetical protein DYB25_008946 [Aphanomyces astaci]|uniref:SAP domain-containing protein n=1 Tax=Aphanomyces astaci TaxID=112090 RepID=A0A397DMR6_APHAT|nr:hypothetical protein DYB25_008946 [Aphanomyces astaci]RHY12909.1 hypothetical protein DYB36_004164 [Aphanomyces astaci]RHY50485.1 hypothetical protein DYB30_002982 [Aphanomyces astaci]RHY50771.1 hypothetical protein DYB34_005535 [Aphanomyces astaci]RHY64851.1 hypothetical protein DYB38_007044 [Aphanomyces astaci]